MKRTLVTLVVGILLVPVDRLESEAIRRNSMMEFVDGVKQVIAHRGASTERPECTESAIERAIQTLSLIHI